MDGANATRIVKVAQYGVIHGIGFEDISPERRGFLLGKYISLTSRNDNESLSAMGNVGVFQLGPGLVLNIVPRFKTRNLTRMVEACEGSWVNLLDGMSREYVVGRNASQWLQEVLKKQFVKKCGILHMTGLMREYRRRSINTSSPFGHVDIKGSLMLRAKGVFGRLKCSYEERTVDTAANSCLLMALEKSSIPDETVHERNRKKILELFEGVSPRDEEECLGNRFSEESASFPENWKAYRELLDMARLILVGGTLELESLATNGRRLPSLCVDFQHMFEDFVRRMMQMRLGDKYDVLDGNRVKIPLYSPPRPESSMNSIDVIKAPESLVVKSDILVRDRHTRHVLMAAECKCTSLDSYGISQRNEVEQAVVYAVRFGLPSAVIIHPVTKPSDSGMRTPGSIGGITVYQYNVNIDADDIESEMTDMAGSLQKLLDVVIEKGLEVNSDSVQSRIAGGPQSRSGADERV